MKANKLTFVFLIFISMLTKAQKVESKAYELTLKALLSHSVKELGVEEAAQKQDSLIFVDSRERSEYEVSHIKDAIWVGYDEIDLRPVEELDRAKEIVVYCSVGYRSEKVAEKLDSMGFSNVKNLYGGIFEWKNRGNPVYKLNQIETDSIHAYNKVWGIWLNKGEKVYK